MKKTNLILLIIFFLPVVVFGIFVARNKAQVFSDLTLSEARIKAVKQDKFLLVDATADWCQPCKMMDRTTWVDPEVISWVSKNAIAIQVDVDRQKEEAQELQIEVMPTIILFKDGKSTRALGYSDAATLLDWLNRQ